MHIVDRYNRENSGCIFIYIVYFYQEMKYNIFESVKKITMLIFRSVWL